MALVFSLEGQCGQWDTVASSSSSYFIGISLLSKINTANETQSLLLPLLLILMALVFFGRSIRSMRHDHYFWFSWICAFNYKNTISSISETAVQCWRRSSDHSKDTILRYTMAVSIASGSRGDFYTYITCFSPSDAMNFSTDRYLAPREARPPSIDCLATVEKISLIGLFVRCELRGHEATKYLLIGSLSSMERRIWKLFYLSGDVFRNFQTLIIAFFS